MALNHAYRLFRNEDDCVPCLNPPDGATRCQHWHRCKVYSLACKTFRGWVYRSGIPPEDAPPDSPEWRTPSREHYAAVFTNEDDDDAGLSVGRRPDGRFAGRSPKTGVPGRGAPDAIGRGEPGDRAAGAELAAVDRLGGALGEADRPSAEASWRDIVSRRDLR